MDSDIHKKSTREDDNAEAFEVNSESPTAVNSLILDYYKKFGRKRDLEQYFSLSTAQGDVGDPTGLFWRRMKSQNESSDSSGRKVESPTELCRISIKCTVPEQSTSSQEDDSKDKSESVSPPIITEDTTKYSDEESVKSDNHSQKSIDLALDTSMNKPLSPTSSITSQRKLEWDSLADVGYGHESDIKTSASSLSTLERLALKQQYSNNDTKQETELGPPTAHSTFLDQSDNKNKSKKGYIKKTTIHNRDIDLVEVKLPEGEIRHQAINVNLTKHISFSVEKDGAISLGNIKKDFNISPEKKDLSGTQENKNASDTPENNDLISTPEKVYVETEITPQIKFDKEIQTTLTKNKETTSPKEESKAKPVYIHKVPVLINLNTLKKRNKKKKLKTVRKRSRSWKKLDTDKENVPVQEKSGFQVSEAESFEYMPGHMYNQNQINRNQSDPKFSSCVGNKSSLESSGAPTTDSSKSSKYSFTKDLEKSINLLNIALKHRYDDPTLKKKLIKDIVQRLIKSNYRDDDNTTDFLSGLSFSSKKIGLGESQTTTSTSDGNHTRENVKLPKKSILRLDRFNANALKSTSQSAPNLPVASTSEKPLLPRLTKLLTSSNTESDESSKKNLSDAKTSSEELYQKYLEAVRREETYKRHLKDKENLLRQKLVRSDTTFKIPSRPDLKANSKLQDLLKDLTRNNYDDGSGDASKLEGGSNSNVVDYERGNALKNQRSHSVFTLSSANSDCCQHRRHNFKKRLQQEIKDSKGSGSRDGPSQCECAKAPKIDVADSSVQVNLKNTSSNIGSLEQRGPCSCKTSLRDTEKVSDIKYVCLCAEDDLHTHGVLPNMYIYKCSRVSDQNLASAAPTTYEMNKDSRNHSCQPSTSKVKEDNINDNGTTSLNMAEVRRNSQSSQTNINMGSNLIRQGGSANISSTDSKSSQRTLTKKDDHMFIHEATRCIQTEISINAKISDPCLSDINIVNDRDCCTVEHENYRMISKPNSKNDLEQFAKEGSETRISHKQIAAKDSQTDCDLCIRSNIPNTTRTSEKEVQSNVETTVEPVFNEPSDKNEDNFTIPIQGTNMTLLVSIGANRTDNDHKNTGKVNEATVTDDVHVAEKATCLTEECSKGVQSQATDIFYTNDQPLCSRAPERNMNPAVYPVKETIHPLKRSCIVNTCITNKKASTYPRTVQINEPKPKPFVRSNTDSGKFITTSCGQTGETVPDIDDSAQNINVCEYGESKKDTPYIDSQQSKEIVSGISSERSSKNSCRNDHGEVSDEPATSGKSSSDSTKDPIMNIIKDITRRYSKKDIEKNKRRKCFKEIVTVLNYLLDTDDGDHDDVMGSDSSQVSCDATGKTNINVDTSSCTKPIKMVDKSVQLNARKSKDKCCITESSEMPSSSDSATCKVLNRIKKECEKYHQKKCKCNGGIKCDASSSTSNCIQHHRHYCHCRSHKCKAYRQKSTEKVKKKCLAYNLIIQTSDSMVSDELPTKNCKPLKHIVVKVPPKNKQRENMPFKEVYAKIEKNVPGYSPREALYRSRSCLNESECSSECNCPPEECKQKCKGYTVRDYLEKNRPDFVVRSSDRQNSLKTISEKRANERAAQRRLLSLQLDQWPLSAVNESELRQFMNELGVHFRRKKLPPKFISEKEMKKHSEKIYKSLPEVVQKKEDKRKENIKKTNLLMANIFKKNLQKNTLRGAVNLSNYNTVIKI